MGFQRFFRQTMMAAAMSVAVGAWANAAPSAADNAASIRWQSCDAPRFRQWFTASFSPDKQLECATLTTPLDNGKPDGKKVTLALTRLPAKSADAQNLLIIAGGPGQASLDVSTSFETLQTRQTKQLRQSYHLIGYAPRGVAPSKPAISCGWGSRDAKEFVEQCTLNTSGEVLANIGTPSVVEDIEHIRKALGGDPINIVAYSYGTKVLSAYAQKYPNGLRAGIADGVVDVTQGLFEHQALQERAFQESFNRFVAYCLQNSPCIFIDAASANRQFHTFLQSIDDKGLYDKTFKPISASDVLSVFVENLYWAQDWDKNISLMNELSVGVTTAFDDSLSSDDGVDDVAFEVISCADYALKRSQRDKAHYVAASRRIDALSAFDNYQAQDDEYYLDPCFYWPYDGADDLAAPKVGENPPKLLFIAQSHDPTTPLTAAAKMAKFWRAPLLIRQGNGHTLTFQDDSQCVDKAALRFLQNPTKTSSQVCYD